MAASASAPATRAHHYTTMPRPCLGTRGWAVAVADLLVTGFWAGAGVPRVVAAIMARVCVPGVVAGAVVPGVYTLTTGFFVGVA